MSINFLETFCEQINVTRKRFGITLPFRYCLDFYEKDTALRTRLKYFANTMKPMKPVFWLIRPFYFFKTYKFYGHFRWEKEPKNDL